MPHIERAESLLTIVDTQPGFFDDAKMSPDVHGQDTSASRAATPGSTRHGRRAKGLVFERLRTIAYARRTAWGCRGSAPSRFARRARSLLLGAQVREREAMFGIANGLLAQTGNSLHGAAREGVAETSRAIVGSPLVGEQGVFSAIGSVAWMVGVIAAIMALRHDGVRRAPLILLAIGALMVFHVPPFGSTALICLAAGAYLTERRRSATFGAGRDLVPA
jgi:hypothetical protein